jgi:hypothetical protein
MSVQELEPQATAQAGLPVPNEPPAGERLLDRLLAFLERGDSVLALGLVWLVMLRVQNGSANIIGIDGYYHVKFAYLMREHGLRLDFPWLPLTILNERAFSDHHLLYHILLIPFTYWHDCAQFFGALMNRELTGSFYDSLRLGGKAAGLVYSVLAIVSVYLVMLGLRIRYALVWLLVLLGSGEWFLERLAMTRRQSVSLACLMLAVYLLATRRYRWLVPLAFAYAWLFDGYILLLGIAGLAFLAELIATRRLTWPILGWTALGLVLGVVFNPYFPNNVTFTYLHILPKVIPVPEEQVRVGSEWYPFAPRFLLQTSWLPLLLVALLPLPFLRRLLRPATLGEDVRRILRDPTALFLGGLSLLFLVLYLRSRRFIESEPGFAVLACAYVWDRYLPAAGLSGLWSRAPLLGRLAAVLLLGAGLTWQAVGVTRTAAQRAEDNHAYTTFQDAAIWLSQNTSPGERIYHSDWDDFPELFFFDTNNTYMVGLDPTYMNLENPDLYQLWRSIGRGQVPLPAQAIRDQLGSRWAITDRAHPEFIRQADADPDMAKVFETQGAIVYRIRATSG